MFGQPPGRFGLANAPNHGNPGGRSIFFGSIEAALGHLHL
jgi:hypothetical protein